MTTKVRVIDVNATVLEAAKKMDEENVGALPVCDCDELVGIVTDRDICIRATAAGWTPTTIKVRDVMTSPVIYAFEDQTLEEAGELMQQNLIRRLPVFDRNQRLVGMVTADDLLIEIPAQAGGIAADVIHAISDVERPGV